jgi:hypothetical protein
MMRHPSNSAVRDLTGIENGAQTPGERTSAPDEMSESGRYADIARRSDRVRRGALWGAGFGFLMGLAPLTASIIMGTLTGALLAKASELRVEGGSPPRIHFAQRAEKQETDTGVTSPA